LRPHERASEPTEPTLSLGSLELGDLNEDSRPDLVAASTVVTSVSDLLNVCQ
jgi:hypothetical protein